jgi:hypothetical protein
MSRWRNISDISPRAKVMVQHLSRSSGCASHRNRLDGSADVGVSGFDSYSGCPRDLKPCALDTSCDVVPGCNSISYAGAILERNWEGEPGIHTGLSV